MSGEAPCEAGDVSRRPYMLYHNAYKECMYYTYTFLLMEVKFCVNKILQGEIRWVYHFWRKCILLKKQKIYNEVGTLLLTKGQYT